MTQKETDILLEFASWLSTREKSATIGANEETPLVIELTRGFIDSKQE